ncbi:hypothetical protein [Pseudonocardia sp.]|uniref:hypothetical protein n=1 Tax=Pseudonocardia sp. TaxID=60912 RepID=UPI002622C600|nr:hypothetical protein [Pseudonocardia sp.]
MAALDAEVRRDLRGLQKDTADTVARHLVAAGSLVEEDPQLALEHARYARKRASRIAVVREATGIAAYHAGEWTEALAELRAARRMGGGPVHLPVMADIERALGRPERAVDIARGPEAAELGTAERIELAIVGAGARRDLGELDAAVVGLQIAELDPARRDPWSPRLFYAYADNLLAAGRESDALQWFAHAVDADPHGTTDAGARIAELTGTEPPDESDDFEFGEEELADLVAEPDPDPGPARSPAPAVGTAVREDTAADGAAAGAPVMDGPAVAEADAGEDSDRAGGVGADEGAGDTGGRGGDAPAGTSGAHAAASGADGDRAGEGRPSDGRAAAVEEPAAEEQAGEEPAAGDVHGGAAGAQPDTRDEAP